MNNILRKNGYTLVKNPTSNIRPLQLILKTSESNAEQLNSNISELFSSERYPVPLIDDNISMYHSSFLKEDIELGLEGHANLLTNLLKLVNIKSADILMHYNTNASVELQIKSPTKSVVNLIQLDRFVGNAKLSEGIVYIKEKLMDDAIFIITEVISTKEFSLSINSDKSLKGELNLKANILESDASFNKDNKLLEAINYKDESPIVIAVKACQVFYSKSFFRKGIFAIKEGKIDTLKNETLPVEILKTAFI